MRQNFTVLPIMAMMFAWERPYMAQTNASTLVKNIVLVQGAFVDGSTWRGVYDLLKQDGYNVAVVQNRTLSLEGDAASTRRVIDAQDGPVVLVGHSYGGAEPLRQEADVAGKDWQIFLKFDWPAVRLGPNACRLCQKEVRRGFSATST